MSLEEKMEFPDWDAFKELVKRRKKKMHLGRKKCIHALMIS